MEKEIIQFFIDVVGKENVKHSTAQLLAYSYDATANFQALPEIVVSPRNTEEVCQIVKICNEYKIPIVPRGSGSNLAAGTVPNQGGVVILFNNMNQIIEFDRENLTITVQPGMITADICHFVEKENLFYPPDPSSM
ncbi:FAD-binding protein, partial [Butyricicoccus sp. 1XD8-22]